MVKTLFLEVMMSSKEDEDEMSFKDECKSNEEMRKDLPTWGRIRLVDEFRF